MTKRFIATQQADTSQLQLPDPFLAPALFQSLFWKPRFLTDALVSGHLPLLYWVTSVLRPRRVCVLGADNGVAHFAFCQALERLGVDAMCESFGFWPEAGTVPAALVKHQDMLYDCLSKLMPYPTPNAAIEAMSAGNIDLLFCDLTALPSLDNITLQLLLPLLSDHGVLILHGLEGLQGAEALTQSLSAHLVSGGYVNFPADGGLLLISAHSDLPLPLKSLLEASADGMLRRDIEQVFRRCGQGMRAVAACAAQTDANQQLEKSIAKTRALLKQTQQENEGLTASYEARSRKLAEIQVELFGLTENHQKQCDELNLVSEDLRNSLKEADQTIAELKTAQDAALKDLEAERKLRFHETAELARISEELRKQLGQAEDMLAKVKVEAEDSALESKRNIKLQHGLQIAKAEAKEAMKLLEAERHIRFEETAVLTRIAEELRGNSTSRTVALSPLAKAEAFDAELKAERSARFSETAALTKTIQDLQRQLHDVMQEKHEHEQRNRDLLSSTSWRITAPIRAIKNKFNRK